MKPLYNLILLFILISSVAAFILSDVRTEFTRNSNLSSIIQNSVEEKTCNTKFRHCKHTGGYCDVKTGVLTCSCPEDSVYDAIAGCKVEEKTCNTKLRHCIHTGGYCDVKTGVLTCSCPADSVYDAIEGCKVEEKTCNTELPNCKQTGGNCDVKTGTLTCSCPEDSVYDATDGCKVEEKTCNTKLRYCIHTGGYCKLRTGVLTCSCPADSVYDAIEGCKDKCAAINCKNGGVCIFQDGQPKCKCIEGYGGEFCETDDLCPDVCGTLVGVICSGEKTDKNLITCSCEEENEIFVHKDQGCKDKCSTMKCYNKGICYINNGTAICNCTANFTGKYCEKNKCSILKCLNNGTCEIKGGKAVCRCSDGFTGKFCEKNLTSVDDTGDNILVSFYFNKNSTFAKGAKFDFHFGRKKESNRTLTEVLLRFNSESVVPLHNDTCSLSCENGGSCEVKNGKAMCACTDHYFGEYCEKECNCKNGKCLEMSGKVDCVCNPEFGKYEEGVCKACGCGKGATCTFEGSMWTPFKNKTCICPENFIEIHHICVDPDVYNPCRSNPCENGARCEKNGFEAKCICLPGYSGKLCQYDKCSLIICLNRGKCEIRNERATCICKDNFTGEFCENENHGYVREGVLQEE